MTIRDRYICSLIFSLQNVVNDVVLKEISNNIDKLIKLSDDDVIDYFLVILNKYANLGVKIEKNMDDIFAKLVLLGNGKYQDVQEIIKRKNWLEETGITFENIPLSEHHSNILEIFDKFNIILSNSNIDYYYTSGILGYLLINRGLERFHHDIDILINEIDFNRLLDVINKTEFKYKFKLKHEKDGTSTCDFKIFYNDYDVPISIFFFERVENDIIINKKYFYSDGKLFVKNNFNTKNGIELSFDDALHYHNGIPYKAITLEVIYVSKNNRRIKDVYDCNIMKSHIDLSKVSKLEKLQEPQPEICSVSNKKMIKMIEMSRCRCGK